MCYKKPLIDRPPIIKSGDIAFVMPKAMQEKADEIAVGLQLICKRKLFGAVYAELMPEFFNEASPDSGVMIAAFVPTSKVLINVLFPGDIDLLIIPYDKEHLLLSQTLVVELKIVRATFIRQDRSPNQFGFSQAQALLACGFPYAGVAHVIVSDESPESAWREVYEATILDETGKCSELKPIFRDMMPSALIGRSFGRLQTNCPSEELGYVAAYLAEEDVWYPSGRSATQNSELSYETMDAIGEFYENNVKRFLDTPTF
ncbi:hypothetical protein ACGK9R_10320 [Halomonas sp. HNIBRBA4712]|uniref:hypothetical protein n=1 Tax=Halomonas sp. HNIBRBA4712 TaxID=3373087 RepID=UPI003746830A